MVEIEVANRSGVEVDEHAAVELARQVLAGEGVDEGELGIAFVPRTRSGASSANTSASTRPTDVLSFPIDGRDALPDGVPRQLGDAVLCPQVTGDAWRGPLVHGLLHLLGYDHGDEMEAREEVYEA